ncbi:aminoacyl tRNA synthase complex-interacting multifunctional protein 1-like isoform X2 [Ostrea edulis]|nr:aminoacyl tRNA synthase complex-interacting multifunctional protein 1-like isoform X2 [Ostrea edulis]XP_056011578.1 aminoacyl tRNA synthase complex-interacting multifunctional protein 1-like isoform X2 [Ostrea edulis]
MASASVLSRLNQRAKQAESMITDLKQQIAILRQNAAITISNPEEERLRVENQKLRSDVEELKSQLILTEIRNGVKQIPLPTNRTVAKAEPPKKEPTNQPEIKQAPAAANNKDQKPEKSNKKEKKVKQSAADGEPKAKKGKNEPKTEEKMDVSRLDFRVGKIIDVKKHPDADTLYVEEVDMGEGRNRTVVSGLVNHVPLEQMQNKVAVFMCNLKPAKMRGILSEAMIMCASTPEKVEILNIPPGAAIGDKVTCKAYPGAPDVQLQPKKKVWETLAPDLKVNKEKVATFRGDPLVIEGKGALTAPSLKDVQIK